MVHTGSTKKGGADSGGPDYSKVQRNLALELVRVTEAAALASGRWLGKGDKNAADQVSRLHVGLMMGAVVVSSSGRIKGLSVICLRGMRVALGGVRVHVAVGTESGTSTSTGQHA